MTDEEFRIDWGSDRFFTVQPAVSWRPMTITHDGLTIDWLGYACARIEGDDAVVYTDPGRYGTLTGEWRSKYGEFSHPAMGPYDAQDGDVVVVTHDHHYDDDGVRRVAASDATVIVYEAVSASGVRENSGRDVVEPEDLPYSVRRVGYSDDIHIDGVDVRVIPAYNESDGPRANPDGSVPHPRDFGCGFVVTVDGVSCFWTGDSDAIDDHRTLEVSLFMPSIARSFTMNRHDAADLADHLAPDLVLPIHYNTFEALQADSAAFASDVATRGVPVVLDERSPTR